MRLCLATGSAHSDAVERKALTAFALFNEKGRKALMMP
jgi:hypothetical protein